MKTLVAGDKRNPPPILGQRHTFNCIARDSEIFPILFTILRCPCCTDWYEWYVASKALVLSLRSVWCHGNHVNVHASDATIIVTVDSQAHVIQVHKCCTKWETFRFALPAWNLFTQKNESRALSQLSAGQVFGRIRVLTNSRNRCNLSLFRFHYRAWLHSPSSRSKLSRAWITISGLSLADCTARWRILRHFLMSRTDLVGTRYPKI